MFFEILFTRSFTATTARVSEVNSRDVILFQIMVSSRNIKEITLATYFIKVTARLRKIRRVNRVH